MRRWKKMNVRSVWWPETSLQGLERLPRIMGRLLILKVMSVTAPLCSCMHGARQSGQYLNCVTGIKAFGKEELRVQLHCQSSGCFTSLWATSLYMGVNLNRSLGIKTTNAELTLYIELNVLFCFVKYHWMLFFSVFKNQCDSPDYFLRIISKKYKW